MILGIWGEDKTCKTTLALSAPKKLVEMEFDIGGFTRANRNLQHLKLYDDFKAGLIKHEEFVMPFQIGSIDPVKNIVRPSKILVGIKELFYKFAGSFIRNLKDNSIQSIAVDTGTLLYEITCLGYLQEKQEVQFDSKGNLLPGERLRVQLQQTEYREPYARMRGFIYQAKAHKKNLILTHHATDEYGLTKLKDGTLGEGKTGRRTYHGWQQLGDGADMIVHTYIKEIPEVDEETGKQILVNGKPKKKRIPYCQVELCEVQEMVGMEFREPTWDMLAQALKMIRGN